MAEVRMTLAVAKVLREFLTDPGRARYGYELMQVTGYPSGKLYPVLARLVHAEWLLRDKEDVSPSLVGRPARYMYCLTEHGVEAARYQLALLSEQLAPPPRMRSRLQSEGGRT